MVYSKRCFSDSPPPLATEANRFRGPKNAWKHLWFQALWCLLHLRILTSLWTYHSEKHRLENTVCYSLENAPFSCTNANLPNRTCFTRLPVYPHFWPTGIFQRRGAGVCSVLLWGPMQQEFDTPPPALIHLANSHSVCEFSDMLLLGARLRGRTATQRSRKGSEKVLGRVLGKGSQKGSEKGVCYGFYSKKGFWEGFSEGVLRRGFPEGAWNAPL